VPSRTTNRPRWRSGGLVHYGATYGNILLCKSTLGRFVDPAREGDVPVTCFACLMHSKVFRG